MRRSIIAGNWKMNATLREAEALVTALVQRPIPETVEVVVCPPFTAISHVARLLAGSRIGLGAQDLFWESAGAFTGEISAPMLVDLGCRYVIIGHSERRTYFGETNEWVSRKLRAALAAGLAPIVCVGETLAQREANQTMEIIDQQLTSALTGLSAADLSRLIIAYEPVWAIGTGKNATPEQAQEVHLFIRNGLSQRFSQQAAESVRIQYGGSVNAANAASLLQLPDVDGALVGGASLKADAFQAIVQAAQRRGQGAALK
ncbi:MAG: triose-phosphate isomerase [Candidatus Omnitrophica bacterium]|nr:triose-phosphate isomerase [Candidatus Omnitrophota bacterium]MBI2174443.1 triose-phosphate isomerase [Candidatus Omnitrophota bacterium]